MKKVLIASLVVALMLVTGMVMPAMAAEDTVPASVTVNTYISFTITDYTSTEGGSSGDGLLFGDLDPDTLNEPEGAQTLGTPTAAVKLTVAAETNVGCDIQVKGTDFNGGDGTIDISNAKWDTDSAVAGATAMSTGYATITTSTALTLKEQDVWHWLSIPSVQEAGSYSSTFSYQATATP